MCFFTASYLLDSESSFNTTIPDTMQLAHFLQTYEIGGEIELQMYVAILAENNKKLLRGHAVLLREAVQTATGQERYSYQQMLNVVQRYL